MIIAVYGAGYVGLVSAVCFAKLGHSIICVDVDSQRIEMLSQGICPIHEEGLPELLKAQLASARLSFTTDLVQAIQHAAVHIIATGTPSLEDGSADLSQVYSVVSSIVEHAKTAGIIVTKSTVPIGTGDAIEKMVKEQSQQLKHSFTLDVASNPEFLREGTAVYDFLHADRIVVGAVDAAVERLKKVYQPLIDQGVPFLAMTRRSAELTKYSANAMLACKISFINKISQLAESLEANIDEVRQGIALDKRIGPHFLLPGIGYGGSCFPKDVRALVQIANTLGVDSTFLHAIEQVNSAQKNWVYAKVFEHFNGKLQDLTIGFWGLSFKPGTDDLREASSLVAIKALISAGANIVVFDPAAMPLAQKSWAESSSIIWCDQAQAVLNLNLDALVIATEWNDFKAFSLSLLNEKLNYTPVFDGRNCFDLNAVREAQLFCYYSVGRPVLKRIDMESVTYAS